MIQYEDVVLQESDIDTLREKRCFLVDKVFAFYFAYLKSTYKTDDVLLVEPTMSFWLAHCDQTAASSFAEENKMSTKSLVLFVVNDHDPSVEGDTGNHWSTLVYHRSMNSFIHFDTMEGKNNHDAAMVLYEAVKSYMGAGGQAARLQTSKKKKDKKKSARSVCKPPLDVPVTAPAGLPVFRESEDIQQQSNEYDCGTYVLAIAEVICHWYKNEMNNTTQVDLLSAVAKKVDHSVEFQMRDKVLGIIQELGSKKSKTSKKDEF